MNFGLGASLTEIRSDDVKFLGSARGRLGYTPYYNVLLYGTAGLAWERLDQTNTTTQVSPPFAITANSTTPTDWFGWVAGAGGEVMLTGNWIARLEYLHYGFETVRTTNSQSSNLPGFVNFSDGSGNQDIDVVRGAISYKVN